jgi:hypothetical protein
MDDLPAWRADNDQCSDVGNTVRGRVKYPEGQVLIEVVLLAPFTVQKIAVGIISSTIKTQHLVHALPTPVPMLTHSRRLPSCIAPHQMQLPRPIPTVPCRCQTPKRLITPLSNVAILNVVCKTLLMLMTDPHVQYAHAPEGRRALDRLFCVTLLLILCPHALSWNMPMISCWLTPLFALSRVVEVGSPMKPGLPGGDNPAVPAFSIAAAKCQSGCMLLVDGVGRCLPAER